MCGVYILVGASHHYSFFPLLSKQLEVTNMAISEQTTGSNQVWDFMWQTFENASLTYDLVSSHNVTRGNPDNGSTLLDNPAKLGILTGFLIACIVDFRIATSKFQLDASVEAKLRTVMVTLINTISFLLMVPMVTPFLLILFGYRKIVELVLKLELRDDFAGLLEGTDCVWALETSASLSVINVLAVLEKSGDKSINENFMLDFRNLIKDRLISSNFDKLNWIREKKYGYFYWRKNEEIRVEERVGWINDADHDQEGSCDGSCDDVNGDYLKTIFAKATNKPLPREHSTSWEILICKTCAKSSSSRLGEMEEVGLGAEIDDIVVGEGKTTVPLLFRVHHCLGDGVALLRLLLESIADNSKSFKLDNNNLETDALPLSIGIPEATVDVSTSEENHRKLRIPLLRQSSSILGTFTKDNQVVYYSNDLLSASMPFTVRFPIRTLVKSILSYIDDRWKVINSLSADYAKMRVVEMILDIEEKMRRLAKLLAVLISIPNCLVQQTLRSMDNSALRGPDLTGDKILSYWIEEDVGSQAETNLMTKIRDIKNATGTRFSDVILAALSANLHHYFSKIGESAPKNLTVVIPARMAVPSQKLSLQNGFSVGLQKLCISEVDGESVDKEFATNLKLWERLGDVSRSSEKLRKDPDYLINFWVMKWLSAALPESLLKPVLESRSTLVFSNLPGPQQVAILGYNVKNVTFWIPHRGTTGIGCSFLTYGGKVHISLVADSALVKSSNLLREILHGTIDNITHLYDNLYCQAPTEKGLGVP